MRIVLIVAQSLDGFITRHDEPGVAWTSPADKAWFRRCLDDFDARIMARATYETERERILAQRENGVRHVVMTRNPSAFAGDARAGSLEFTAAPPAEIRDRLAKAGCRRAALLGGSFAHDAFLAARLVDELWVTIEPHIFGTGTATVKASHEVKLSLKEYRRLPDSDSILACYRVRP